MNIDDHLINHLSNLAKLSFEGESREETAIREVKEESGIALKKEGVYFLGTLYFVCQEIDFEFHLYFSKLLNRPELQLACDETTEGKWWSWAETIHPLIPGGQEVLVFCKKQIDKLNLTVLN